MTLDLTAVLDDGYTVVLYRNMDGSYRAMALCPNETPTLPVITQTRIADDFAPEYAIGKLAEKVFDNFGSK